MLQNSHFLCTFRPASWAGKKLLAGVLLRPLSVYNSPRQ